jgi:hypothetical protein
MSLFFPKNYTRGEISESTALMCVAENSWIAFRTLGGSKLSTIFSSGFTLSEGQGLGSRAEDFFLLCKAKILTQLQDRLSLASLLVNSRRSTPNCLDQLSI